jgi:hypothetical protein
METIELLPLKMAYLTWNEAYLILLPTPPVLGLESRPARIQANLTN